MGVTGRGAPGNWGAWGTREREEEGGAGAVSGGRQPGRSSRGWTAGESKKEKAWDSVVQQGQLDWMWSELPVSTAATGGTPRLTTCRFFVLPFLSHLSRLASLVHTPRHPPSRIIWIKNYIMTLISAAVFVGIWHGLLGWFENDWSLMLHLYYLIN